jgi:hypothetical protein
MPAKAGIQAFVNLFLPFWMNAATTAGSIWWVYSLAFQSKNSHGKHGKFRKRSLLERTWSESVRQATDTCLFLPCIPWQIFFALLDERADNNQWSHFTAVPLSPLSLRERVGVRGLEKLTL